MTSSWSDHTIAISANEKALQKACAQSHTGVVIKEKSEVRFRLSLGRMKYLSHAIPDS
jgi:hypothetical protein